MELISIAILVVYVCHGMAAKDKAAKERKWKPARPPPPTKFHDHQLPNQPTAPYEAPPAYDYGAPPAYNEHQQPNQPTAPYEAPVAYDQLQPNQPTAPYDHQQPNQPTGPGSPQPGADTGVLPPESSSSPQPGADTGVSPSSESSSSPQPGADTGVLPPESSSSSQPGAGAGVPPKPGSLDYDQGLCIDATAFVRAIKHMYKLVSSAGGGAAKTANLKIKIGCRKARSMAQWAYSMIRPALNAIGHPFQQYQAMGGQMMAKREESTDAADEGSAEMDVDYDDVYDYEDVNE